MEAHLALVRACVVAGLLLPATSFAASHRTENFIVTAMSKSFAREVGEAAERYRRDLAIEWLGHELPRWSQPCPVQVKVGPRLGAGGATSFLFATSEHHYGRPVNMGDGLFQAKPVGRPYGWEMSVQGTRERVLDSVLPHEITHTIFATHFGRPLPRWADEGACTTVEHVSEREKQYRMLREFLTTERGIAFNRMFSMTEYPADILPLYSQGFSLARFLIAQGGKRKFVKYVGAGLDSNNWTAATTDFYGFESISELQVTWLDWVRNGSKEIPNRTAPPVSQIAGNTGRASVGSKAGSSRENGSKSWYVRLSQEAQQRTASVPREWQRSPSTARLGSGEVPAARRTTSRPRPGEWQREVLMEWGTPGSFNSPRLADAESTSPR